MTVANRVTIAAPRSQKGAVLLVGLIMVLLMTIVGMAAIRGSGLQEIMAGNMRDRNIAFQAAEAGLRSGESFTEETQLELLPFDGTQTGLLEDQSLPGNTDIPDWDADDWADGREVDFELDTVAEQPRFVIENVDVSDYDIKRMLGMGITDTLPFNVEFYRISGRGVDGTGNAEAVVQSNYVKLN